MGISCISRLAIEPLREKGQLVILDTPFWQLTRPLFMLVHRQKYQGPCLKAFMRFCEENKKRLKALFYQSTSFSLAIFLLSFLVWSNFLKISFLARIHLANITLILARLSGYRPLL